MVTFGRKEQKIRINRTVHKFGRIKASCRQPSRGHSGLEDDIPQTVIIFGCVSSDGKLLPPHVFREGFPLNSDSYVELLSTLVKPWMQSLAARWHVLQQDLAPCHTAEKSQKWPSGNLFDRSSPKMRHPNSLLARLQSYGLVRLVRMGHS